MRADSESFDLMELCDRADVTPRTVRYYIQQGLLPSPGTRGPGARYDQRHLDRLRVIRRLQREHLPLAEIRRRVASLDDADVRALADAPPEPRPRSALDYVRHALAGGPAGRVSEPPPGAVAGAADAAGGAPPDRLDADLAEAPVALASSALPPDADEGGEPLPTRSTWERIALAPDVELHVRRPLTRAQNRLVDRLVQQARTLFSEEP